MPEKRNWFNGSGRGRKRASSARSRRLDHVPQWYSNTRDDDGDDDDGDDDDNANGRINRTSEPHSNARGEN
jgi:hypothetical protein